MAQGTQCSVMIYMGVEFEKEQICITGALCCTAETNIVNQLYSNKNQLKRQVPITLNCTSPMFPVSTNALLRSKGSSLCLSLLGGKFTGLQISRQGCMAECWEEMEHSWHLCWRLDGTVLPWWQHIQLSCEVSQQKTLGLDEGARMPRSQGRECH